MKIFSKWVVIGLMSVSCLASASQRSLLSDYHNGRYPQFFAELKNTSADSAQSLYYQGMARVYGYGVPRDESRGLDQIKQAGEQGFLPAQTFMAKYSLLKKDDAAEAFAWFKRAADQDDVEGQLFVTAAYLYGYGVQRHPDKARKYYIAAAKSGNALAEYTLAEHFLQSKHKKDHQLGVLWLQRAVDQKHAPSQVALAKLYLQGGVVDQDSDVALSWLNKAAEQGYSLAYTELGRYYQTGYAPDLSKAKAWFEKAAAENEPQAQYWLGQMAFANNDESDAFAWYLKSAQGGYKLAMLKVAELYKKGTGVDQDDAKGKVWADKAAKTPDSDSKRWRSYSPSQAKQKTIAFLTDGKKATTAFANYRLHGIFEDWRSKEALKSQAQNQSPRMVFVDAKDIFNHQFKTTTPNEISIQQIIEVLGKLRYHDQEQQDIRFPEYDVPDVARVETIKKLAFTGNPVGLFEMAQLYQSGVGVEKDAAKAIEYYEAAVEQNYMRAEYNLAMMYLYGEGVETDYARGVALLESAAFKGLAFAQYALGMMFEFGVEDEATKQQLTINSEYALSMYGLAAVNGLQVSQKHLADLRLKDLFESTKSYSEKQALHQELQALYESASKEGDDDAQLSLAYYYVGSKDEEKRQWAFDVANRLASSNPYANFLLALMYDRGVGTSEHLMAAVELYEKAVQVGNPVAQYILGNYYYRGHGVAKDEQKALALLNKAASAKQPFALYDLAVIMHNQDPNSDFLPILRQADKLNYHRARLLLADYYVTQKNDQSNWRTAAEIYQKLAEKGYPTAQLKLGNMYERGLYFGIDDERAALWYEKSAQQGNRFAQFLLANLYQTGKLGAPDFAKAAYWYEMAAKQRYRPAMNALGYINETMAYDYPHAKAWYEKALKQGSGVAAYNLGLLYEYGKGGDVDYDEAVDYFEAALEHGFLPAQYALAWMYLNGFGVSKNVDRAYTMFSELAKAGGRNAQYQVARIYEQGLVGEKDLNRAMQYYQKAASAGHELAAQALKRHQAAEQKAKAAAEKAALEAQHKAEAQKKVLEAEVKKPAEVESAKKPGQKTS